MADTLLAFGVEKLWDLLVRESERLQGVDEQLTELKSNMNLLRSFLEDADAKKHASAMVRNCVEEIKEIVLDTEDVIETFLLKEELGQTSGIMQRMKRLAFTMGDRRQLAIDMGDILKRISKVIRDMQSFGVQQIIADGSGYSHPLQERQREMRHTFPSENENESDFVGLEKNVKKLVGYLVEEESIQVVSIAGMGGIGKTTLARQVFNHEMVKTHFDGAVWVCVSQDFTRKSVWETILQRLSSKHIDQHRESYMTEEELQYKLFRLLETSKPLIVLDDMWKEEDWDRIKPVFPPTKGWKVLLTSRNEGVALHADPKCVTFKPECLTSEESWMLFQRIAFPKKDTTEFKVGEMEEIGKQMIKHCGGLPLAVKVLGGLLATKYTLNDWKRIHENVRSHIVGGTSFNDRNIRSVYHVLYLSFEELPIYLKHCFLYLAHFPEDYQIKVEDMSYYWEAEGIPRPKHYNGASIRDVAYGYIEELVKRNMVISERFFCTSRFEICQLHDMMREVCLLKAEEENFLQIFDGTSTAISKSPCRSRRLAVHPPHETSHIGRDMKNPKLRSLLFIQCYGTDRNWMESGLCFTRLQLMRVLDLFETKFEGEKLPSTIGKLIHLRYLSLKDAKVSQLPSSMRNLKQLLYLNLDASFGLYMPDFFKEMQQLRYLCLPMWIHNKVKLELGNLIKLETLKNFSTNASNVRDLQGMSRLRVLSVNIESECNVETLSSFLSEMIHLEDLTIDDRYKKNTREFVLDCVHLRKLKLCIHMPRLPGEHHFPSQLTSISLDECRLEEDPMPILEKLPQLKEVDLNSESFSGRRMVCSGGGFPQLRYLKFSRLHELEEWIVEEGSMPLLHTLCIGKCQKLKELPDGIKYITSLEYMSFRAVGEKWKKKLSQGGEDYYKVQHIPSVKFIDSI